jgi:hypothetical protein
MNGDLPNQDIHRPLFDKITEFWKLVYGCRQYYLYCYHLHKPKSQFEHDYLLHSRFFKVTKHIFWRSLVIEIAKLYSNRDNDKYNIQRLLKSLSESGQFKNAKFNKEILEAWGSTIKQKESVINILLGLRDKYYGHTDSPDEKAKINHNLLTIEQVEPLIDMAEDIITRIHSEVFNAGADCRVDFEERDLDIITALANNKHDKIKEMLGPKFNYKKPGEK